jgi:hypothetical protein
MVQGPFGDGDQLTLDRREPETPPQLGDQPAIRHDISAASDTFRLPLADLEPPIVAADATGAVIADLDLRAGKVPDHQEVTRAPGISAPVSDRFEPMPPIVAPLPTGAAATAFPDSGRNRSRSALWPVVLALVMGVAIGAAAMVVLLNRDRGPTVAPEAPAARLAPQTATTSTPREFTEVDAAKSAAAGTEVAQAPDSKAGAGPSADTASVPAPEGGPPRSEQSPARTARGGAEPDRPAPAAIGRLLVQSTPAGARVFVDGRDAGVTPTTLRGLTRGSHSVRLVRDGYASAERTVSITAGRPAQSLVVELSRPAATPRLPTPAPAASATPGRYTGSLVIDSQPPGATVFIDGKQVGTTPLQLRAVDAGSHVVRLERAGHNRWTSAVRIVAGEQIKVSAALER